MDLTNSTVTPSPAGIPGESIAYYIIHALTISSLFFYFFSNFVFLCLFDFDTVTDFCYSWRILFNISCYIPTDCWSYYSCFSLECVKVVGQVSMGQEMGEADAIHQFG